MPERESVSLSSQAVELSETSTYLELTNRLCYYGYPNANGVELPVDDAEERAQSLVNQPVVAKYKRNADGKPNLGGHECSLDPVTNTIQFGTQNVGVHTAVVVKEDTVPVNGVSMTVPCLFATLRIWARNKNVIAAVKRLFAEGHLCNSWEILTSAYEYHDGIKVLTDYVFEACALLGTNNPPAFGETASALALSSECNPELIIAEALSKDMAIAQSEEDSMKEEELVVADAIVPDDGEVADVTDDESVCKDDEKKDKEHSGDDDTASEDVSSLTDRDLRDRISKACREALGERVYGYVTFLFPEEHVVWFEDYARKSDLDYIVFTYEVVDDVVSVGDPVPCSLAVQPKDINATIAEKDAALAATNEKMQNMQSEIDALTPYRDAHMKAEAEAKRAELVQHALRSKLITSEDIESDADVVAALDAGDKAAINNIIAERLVKQFDVETSETIDKTPSSERADVVDETTAITPKQFVNAYLYGAKKGK